MATTRLLDFYKEVLELAKIKVGKDGVLELETNKGRRPVVRDGRVFVLPTTENIKHCVEIDKDTGKPVLVRKLFNPMSEDIVTGDNDSLLLLRDYLELNMVLAFGVIAEILLSLTNSDNDKKIEISDIELIKFVDMVREYQQPTIKKLIDNNTVENWKKIWEIVSLGKPAHEGLVHIYLKRGGKINGEKFNRIANVSFPVYEVLSAAFENNDKMVYGKPLRKKDMHTFLKLYEFIFDEEHERLLQGILFGSKNHFAPGLAALLKAYNNIAKKINRVGKALLNENIDKEDVEEVLLKVLPYSDEEIENIITNLAPEVKELPNESDLLLITNNTEQVATQPQQPTVKQVNQVSNMPAQEPADDISQAEAALFGNTNLQPSSIPVQNPLMTQQVPVTQPPVTPITTHYQQPVMLQYGQPYNQGYGYQQPMMATPIASVF